MNRICYALQVLLCGVPEPEAREPEVREVVREVERRVEVFPWIEDGNLYRLSRRTLHFMTYRDSPLWLNTHHKTCAEAFASVPIDEQGDCTVEPVPVIKLGERYFRKGAEITEIGLPKPDPKNTPKAKAKIKGRS